MSKEGWMDGESPDADYYGDVDDWAACDEHETTYLRGDYCKDCRIEELEARDPLSATITRTIKGQSESHPISTVLGLYEKRIKELEALFSDMVHNDVPGCHVCAHWMKRAKALEGESDVSK